MLEHYLVSYVHRTLFPLGPQESTRGLSVQHIANTIRDQYLLMMAHYGIIQTLLVGMAAFHKEDFGVDEAIQVIQSFAKAFEHSPTYPERALKVLAEKGVKSCAMTGDLAAELGRKPRRLPSEAPAASGEAPAASAGSGARR